MKLSQYALYLLCWMLLSSCESTKQDSTERQKASVAQEQSSKKGVDIDSPAPAGKVCAHPGPTNPILTLLKSEVVDPGPPPNENMVAVRVVDELGRPIKGAKVSHFNVGVSLTNDQGFTWKPLVLGWDGTPTGDRILKTISILAPGYVPQNFKCGLLVNNRSYYLVRMVQKGGVLSGRCVDDEDRPVPGIRLKVKGDWWSPGLELQTDSDGRFATDQAPWREQELVVAEPGWTSRSLLIAPPQDDIRIVVQSCVVDGTQQTYTDDETLPHTYNNYEEYKNPDPKRMSILRGKLFDAAGQPVTEGYLNLRRRDSKLSVYLRASLEKPLRSLIYPPFHEEKVYFEKGEIAIVCDEPGRYDLVWKSEFWEQAIPIFRDICVTKDQQRIELGTATLRFKAQPLHIQVNDQNGEAIAGAIVRLPIGYPHTAMRTNRQGAVHLWIYDPIGITINVAAQGFKSVAQCLSQSELPKQVTVILPSP